MTKIIVLLFFVFCVSCASEAFSYREIGLDELVDYGDTPLSHTVYVGSDESYHYFKWSNGKSGGGWKVDKKSMPFKCEEQHGEAEGRFLIKDERGNYEPWGCS